MNWEEFNSTYRIICILISIILTFYWSCKYAKNEDTSLVSYTLYAKSETKDRYPVLSFCFKKPFIKDKLEEYGINEETDYLDFLEGKSFSADFVNLPYDNMTLQLKNYLIGYYVYYVNGTESNLSASEGKDLFQIHTSYSGFIHQRFFKCFSFNLKMTQRIRTISLRIKKGIFQNISRAEYYSFITLIHYPNQFLRSSGSIRRVWNDRKNYTADYSMWFTVHGMEVINRRNTKVNSCIENWKNYDSALLEDHTISVGCRAPYQLLLNSSIPLCRTREQMKLVKLGPDQNEEIGFQYPCRSVEKIEYSYVDHELDAGIWSGQGNFWIELSFTYQRFREITQSRYLKKNNS